MNNTNTNIDKCCVCFTDFFHLHHRPVVNHCACKTARVCESCAPHTPSCPQCRGPMPRTPTVDFEYFVAVCRDVKSVRCPGCQARVATRAAAKHQASCVAFLGQAYRLERDETESLRTMYRQVEREKDSMRQQLLSNARLIAYLREVSGGGGLSWPSDEDA